MFSPLAVLLALACAPLCLLAGLAGARWARRVGAGAAALTTAALLAAAAGGGGEVIDRPWLLVLGARLSLALDPLGLAHAVLATGLAALVVIYAGAYLAPHLPDGRRGERAEIRFHALILAFMAAMVLLVSAGDLLILFVALELTALASFFLIEFHHEERRARRAARLALVVTSGSSLLFLVGVLLVYARTGTVQIAELRAAGGVGAGATALLVAGVIAKSALVPLHFWLPRAMVAPTPVSAYLHSAALVAAGVFVLQRLHFLIAPEPAVQGALLAVGIASIAVGSARALVADPLKEILASSTTAQYGYVAVLIASGGPSGVAGAPLYVLVHGVAKSALFLTAGAVTEATGSDRLSHLGGLRRGHGWLAAGSAVAAAALAGLPVTAGYFKDELFFAATERHAPALAAGAVLAAAATLAYSARFWSGIFLGPPRGAQPYPVPRAMTGAVLVLAALLLAGALTPATLEAIARGAGSVIAGRPLPVELSYDLSARPELLMEVLAWAGGALLYATRLRWRGGLAHVVRLAAVAAGPDQRARRVSERLRRLSRFLHGLDERDLRDRTASIVVVTAALFAAAMLAVGGGPDLAVGELDRSSLPVALTLTLMSACALAAARARAPLTLVLLLSFVGFGLALAYAFSAAPDVALVAAVIEILFTFLLLAMLSGLRRDAFPWATPGVSRARRRGPLTLASGAMAALLSWVSLSSTSGDTTVALDQLAWTESAHSGDAVAAVLVDFRGLDTAVELTILAAAVFGMAAVRFRRRP